MKRVFTAIFMLAAAVSFAADQIVIYAASSVTDMMDEIMAAYNKDNGTNIVGSYAASGTLARQIGAGSPAAIFISADPKWMDELEKKDLIDDKSRKDYLGNKLVLVANIKSKLSYDFKAENTLDGLLKKGERFTIGDPQYVPAGKYAQQALVKLGQWDKLLPHLVLADNVRVALMYVERDEAVLGAVYGSDAAASGKVKILSNFPDDSYAAIRYPIAIIKQNKNEEVEKFYKHLTSPEIKKTIEKYGFSPL